MLRWSLNCTRLASAMKINSSQTPTAEKAITLSKAVAGRQLRISALAGNACQKLREIGFCENMEISKLSNGRNMICSVCGTRLALSKKLGDQVLVEMI